MRYVVLLLLASAIARASAPVPAIRLYAGYTTRVLCQGKLHLSATGNDALVRLEPFPKELGCGVFLKPRLVSGRTNLVLETSTGTIDRIVEVRQPSKPPELEDLTYSFLGDSK